MYSSYAFEVCCGIAVGFIFILWMAVKGEPEIDDANKDNE